MSETTSNQHDLTSNCKKEPMVAGHFGQQRDGVDQQNMLTASTNVMCKQATSHNVITSGKYNLHPSREASGTPASDGASSVPPRRQRSSDMQFGSGSLHSQASAQHPQTTAADCRSQLELHQGSDAHDSNVTPLRCKSLHHGGHVSGLQSYQHSSSSPFNSEGQAQHEGVSLLPAHWNAWDWSMTGQSLQHFPVGCGQDTLCSSGLPAKNPPSVAHQDWAQQPWQTLCHQQEQQEHQQAAWASSNMGAIEPGSSCEWYPMSDQPGTMSAFTDMPSADFDAAASMWMLQTYNGMGNLAPGEDLKCKGESCVCL